MIARRFPSLRTRQRAPSGNYTREFYLKFAEAYDRVEWHREGRESTRAILAKRYRVTDAVIGKWIAAARRAGYLTRADAKGSRGGELTRRAKALIEERNVWYQLPWSHSEADKLRKVWLKKL